MSQVMDSDALDTSLLCTSVHFSMEIGFCDGKDAVSWLHSVQTFEVILHFITQKRGHLNHSVALGCLGVCNHVTAFDSLIGFGDRDGLFFKIEVGGGKRQ